MLQDSQNPFKSIPAVKNQPRITVAVVNHAPIESGYFQEMRGIVCGCINSLNRNSEISFDRMLCDTGSCKTVQRNDAAIIKIPIIENMQWSTR
jgi:hypothetical protein